MKSIGFVPELTTVFFVFCKGMVGFPKKTVVKVIYIYILKSFQTRNHEKIWEGLFFPIFRL